MSTRERVAVAIESLGIAAVTAFCGFAIAGAIDAGYHKADIAPLAVATLLYGTAGMALSVLSLGVIAAVVRVRKRAWRAVPGGLAAGALTVAALIVGYGIVILNRWILVDYSWKSNVALGATAGFVAAAGLATLFGVRALYRRLPAYAPPRWLRFGLVGFLALVALSTVVALLPDRTVVAQRHASSDDLPNVVIVVSDCTRARQVSAYGYERETTPTFDRIAREGMLFEDAHATASWTLASVTGMLASTRAGVDVRPGVAGTELDASTLPEVLRGLGYTTLAASNNPHLGGPFGIGSRFDVFDGGTAPWQKALDNTLVGVVRQRFLIDDGTMVDRTIDSLEELPEPFFVYLHVMGGHAPYEYPSDYEPAFPIPHVDEPISGPHASMEISDAQRANLIARYDVMIRYTDDQLARVVAALEERGVMDRTLFMYTADHGEEFGEHGDWTHGRSLHTETLHVPLAMRWPGRIEAGSRRPEVVSLLDIGPTILTAIARDDASDLIPERWQGSDLGLDADSRSDTPVIAELGPSFRALISREWKYMVDEADGTARLYDRIGDPGETRDLARERPEVVAELERELRARLAGTTSGLRVDDGPAASPALIEQLRALGYVEE